MRFTRVKCGGIELECERQGQDVEVQRVEALFATVEDALVFEKHRVLKARDVATALEILKKEKVDLITIDIMLSPGAALESTVSSQLAGVYLRARSGVNQRYGRTNTLYACVLSLQCLQYLHAIYYPQRAGYFGRGSSPGCP
jgi:hypothetical protein